MIVALIPAHNEEAGIAKTIESLLTQGLDRIVVIANNCTDRTAEVASQYSVEVMVMPDNPHKKSGALNYAWAKYQDADYIFTMDADTVVSEGCIENMLNEIAGRAAVCARYWASPKSGLIYQLQRLEYVRFDDTRQIRNWKVQVASGAAVLYSGPALLEVCEAMDRDHPWDNESLIEDYALTLDLKTIGHKVSASSDAHVQTDTPESFKELWRQRQRWARGGIDEVRKRGWTRATRRDILSYYLFGFSMLARLVWITLIATLIILSLPFHFSVVGFAIIFLMWLERVSSVIYAVRDLRGLSLAGTLVIEDFYGFFLEACSTTAAVKSLTNRKQDW